MEAVRGASEIGDYSVRVRIMQELGCKYTHVNDNSLDCGMLSTASPSIPLDFALTISDS